MHDIIVIFNLILFIFYYLSRSLLFSFLVDSEIIYRIIQLLIHYYHILYLTIETHGIVWMTESEVKLRINVLYFLIICNK